MERRPRPATYDRLDYIEREDVLNGWRAERLRRSSREKLREDTERTLRERGREARRREAMRREREVEEIRIIEMDRRRKDSELEERKARKEFNEKRMLEEEMKMEENHERAERQPRFLETRSDRERLFLLRPRSG